VDAFTKKLNANRRRKEIRERAIAYLGGACTICGYNKCSAAYDFHHPNPLEKDFSISARMTSWEAIAVELKKCILLCANCHREVHDGLHPSFLLDESHDRGGDDRRLDMFGD
jgi:predicted HNH restriction endonuclease